MVRCLQKPSPVTTESAAARRPHGRPAQTMDTTRIDNSRCGEVAPSAHRHWAGGRSRAQRVETLDSFDLEPTTICLTSVRTKTAGPVVDQMASTGVVQAHD